MQAWVWKEACWQPLTWKARSSFPIVSLEGAGLELGCLRDVHIQFLEHADGPFSVIKL